jgi:hypothetical protein
MPAVLPSEFVAFLEFRTNEGVVNRAPRYETYATNNLLCGCFTAEQLPRRGSAPGRWKISVHSDLTLRNYHDAQLIRDNNQLPQYGTYTLTMTRYNGTERTIQNAQLCNTTYMVHIARNGVTNLPVLMFDLNTTEQLMDLDPPYTNTPQPRLDWINHLLMIRRNLNDDIPFHDPYSVRGGGGGGGGGVSLTTASRWNTRRTDDNAAAAGGAGGGGMVITAGLGSGRGGGDNRYYNVFNNDIYDFIQYNNESNGAATDNTTSAEATTRAASASGASAVARPLETFVAEALLREAIRTNMTCSISMEPIESHGCVVTNCFHIFRQDALDTWRTTRNICPVCRTSLVYRPVSVSGAAAQNSSTVASALVSASAPPTSAPPLN